MAFTATQCDANRAAYGKCFFEYTPNSVPDKPGLWLYAGNGRAPVSNPTSYVLQYVEGFSRGFWAYMGPIPLVQVAAPVVTWRTPTDADATQQPRRMCRVWDTEGQTKVCRTLLAVTKTQKRRDGLVFRTISDKGQFGTWKFCEVTDDAYDFVNDRPA